MKQRRSLILVALLLAALWAPPASHASADTPVNSYIVTPLGSLGGTRATTAYGVNDAGQVVGTSQPAITGVGSRAFLWKNGVMADLGTLGGNDSEARAINNSGQVVGWANTADSGALRAFIWDAATGMLSVGTLGGTSSVAYGINDAGQVVGTSKTAAGTDHAFLWQGGRMVDLGVPAGYTHSYAYSINASGQVVGGLADLNGSNRAFVWTPTAPNGSTGTMAALHPSGGNSAYGINSAGEAVGWAIWPDGSELATLWDGAGAHALPLLPYTGKSLASAINDARVVVGDFSEYWEDPGYGHPDGPSYQPPTSGWIPHAFVWDAANGTRHLGGLVGVSVSLSHAQAINSTGQIAADAYLLTPSPLPVPPNLGAGGGDNRVNLAWSSSSGATSYTVKRSGVSGGPYTVLASGITGTTYTDSLVVNGNRYYYVVSAVNAYGESAHSNETSALAMPPPAAPTGLSAAAADRQVSLAWNASAGADLYYVYRGTSSGGPYTTLGYVAGTSFTDSGDGYDEYGAWRYLQNGTTYYYVVTAANSSGESGFSNEASATPMPPPPPPAPTGLTATAGDTQVNLTWNSVTGADYYQLKRSSTSGGPYTVIAATSATSHTDTGLTNGSTYYYVVTAVNAGGASPDSSQVSATPNGPPPPAAPTNLAATAGKRKATLKWTQSASAGVTQNRVYRSTTSGGGYSLRATISAGTSFNDTGLTSGVTYYYVVTAVSSIGKESAYSNQASAKSR